MPIDDDMAQLERIAKRLEEADVPFEETLALFEEGTAVAKQIKTQLEQARLRIRKAVEDSDGLLRIEEFDLE
jgi:exodeoxyribonuclease VII small subunit